MVRSDIPVGAQAAQASHAAFQFGIEHPEVTLDWFSQSNYLILLSVPDEDTLLEYADLTAYAGVPCTLINEPDLHGTSPTERGYTALAIAPSQFGSKLSSLPLLGREVAAA